MIAHEVLAERVHADVRAELARMAEDLRGTINEYETTWTLGEVEWGEADTREESGAFVPDYTSASVVVQDDGHSSNVLLATWEDGEVWIE